MISDKGSPLSVLPWEEASGFLKLLKAILPTCGQVLFRPYEFFRKLADRGDTDVKKRIRAAFAFALVMGYLKLLLDVINVVWLKTVGSGAFFSSAVPQASLVSLAFLDSPLFVLRPLVTLGVTFSLVAFGTKLVLGFDRPLIPVLLVVCYQSASNIFFCIPAFGGIFALVWSLALITVGIKVSYAVALPRSLVTAVVIPVMLLFSVVLAMGPSLNRLVVSFYPEVQGQLVQFNDLTAYASMTAVVSAAEEYKKEMGFYPAHLGVLRRYLSGSVADFVTDPGMPAGYGYDYMRSDDDNYLLTARPGRMDQTGRFVFYTDQAGRIRLDGPQGPAIENIQEMEKLVVRKTREEGRPGDRL